MSYDAISALFNQQNPIQPPNPDTMTTGPGSALTGAAGLLGQIGRIAAVAGGFASRDPSMGLRLMQQFDKEDMQNKTGLGYAAAMGMSPQEAEQQGINVPWGTNVQMQAQDMPGEPGVPQPSAPERKPVIQYPTSPEALKEAVLTRHLQAQLAQFSPTYGQGMSPDMVANQAAMEQRTGLKSDFQHNLEARNAQLGQMSGLLDPALYSQETQVGPKGTQDTFRTFPPGHQAMPLEQWNQWPTPQGMIKVGMPVPGHPELVIPNFERADREGRTTMVDLALQASGGDPEAAIKLLRGDKSPKPGTIPAMIQKFEEDNGITLTTPETAMYKEVLNSRSMLGQDPTQTEARVKAVEEAIKHNHGLVKTPEEKANEASINEKLQGNLSAPSLPERAFNAAEGAVMGGIKTIKKAHDIIYEPPQKTVRSGDFTEAFQNLPDIVTTVQDVAPKSGIQAAGQLVGKYINKINMTKDQRKQYIQAILQTTKINDPKFVDAIISQLEPE